MVPEPIPFVQGSAEALCSSLESIEVSDDLLRVRTRVLRSGAGAITAEDVMLASVSNAVVLGFNSVAARPTREAGGAERKKESRRAQGGGTRAFTLRRAETRTAMQQTD